MAGGIHYPPGYSLYARHNRGIIIVYKSPESAHSYVTIIGQNYKEEFFVKTYFTRLCYT